MKYADELYARAFIDSAREKSLPENILIRNFLSLVEKNGDMERISKIVDAIDMMLVEENGGRWVEVETARESSRRLKKTIEHYFDRKDRIIYSINPRMIAGVKITINGDREFDNSLEHRLRKVLT